MGAQTSGVTDHHTIARGTAVSSQCVQTNHVPDEALVNQQGQHPQPSGIPLTVLLIQSVLIGSGMQALHGCQWLCGTCVLL